MRIVLVVGAVLLGLVILGLAVFLAAFDIDRYRPTVAARLESALGKPVEIGRISLGWGGGPVLRLEQLTVYAAAEKREKPEWEAESMKLAVPIRSLIQSVRKGGLSVFPSFRFSARKVKSAAVKSPIDSLEATIDNFSPNRGFTLTRFFARLGDGTVKAQAKVVDLDTRPHAALEFSMENLSLESVLPTVAQSEPQLRGRLSASFQGTAQGAAPEEINGTLTGSGRLKLNDARLANLNIVREVFQPISIVPGLVELLLARLPESYREKLTVRDTILEPIDLPFSVENGTFSFKDLRVATDTLELTGSGRLDLGGKLSSQMTLRMEPELSAAFGRSVEELQALMNPGGRLELPVTVEGILPRVNILPDLQYVAIRVARHVAGDMIGGLLENLLKESGSKP